MNCKGVVLYSLELVSSGLPEGQALQLDIGMKQNIQGQALHAGGVI